jgi:hypothetical protein
MIVKPPVLRVGNHPVSQGLVWAAAPGRDIPYEAIAGGMATLGSAASLDGATPHGFSHSTTDATNGGVYYPFSELLRTITDKCTIIVWCNVSVLGGWSTLLSIPFTNSGWADPYNMLVLKQESGGSNLYFGFSDTGNVGRTVASDANGIQFTDGWTMYGVTRNGANVRFYRNGKPHGADKTISSNSIGWQSRTVNLINRSSYSPGEGLQGKCPLGMIFNRAISDTEMALLYAFPYIWTEQFDLKISSFIPTEEPPSSSSRIITPITMYSYKRKKI